MRLRAFWPSLACAGVLTLAACSSPAPSPSAATHHQRRQAPLATPIKLDIALGGGAAKGFAHIGVIKMLEANGFTPVVVAGTSAGSVVDALYASGMDAFELQQKAVGLDEPKIRDLQLSPGWLVLGQKLEDYVNEQVRRQTLEQLAKLFVAVATRLKETARAPCLRAAIRAKRCALPAAFPACSSPSPLADTILSIAAPPAWCRWMRRAS